MPITMPLLARRKLLGAVLETDSGTAATVTAALAGTSVKNIKLVPQSFFDNTKRTPQGMYSGSVKAPAGKKLGKLTFTTELRPQDQTLTLLKACRFKDNTGTYKSVSDLTDRKTLTFKVWEGGRVLSIKGASGNAKFNITNGSIVEIEWEFMGVWVDPTNGAMPNTPPVQTAAYVATGLTLTMDGSAMAQVSSISIDLGNAVEEREDIVDASGVKHFIVGDWATTLDMDPEARKVSDYDAYGLFATGTVAAVNVVLTSGDWTFTISMAQVQRTEIDDAERGKVLVDAIKCEVQAENGDDEISFEEINSNP